MKRRRAIGYGIGAVFGIGALNTLLGGPDPEVSENGSSNTPDGAGPTESTPTPPQPPTTEALIDTEPSGLLLTIDAFPANGWQEGDSEDPTRTDFFRLVDGATLNVYSIVDIYDSAAAAEAEYDSMKSSVDYATESVSIGDEAFAYKDTSIIARVVFRDTNAIGTIEYISSSETNPVDLDRAVEFAQTMHDQW